MSGRISRAMFGAGAALALVAMLVVPATAARKPFAARTSQTTNLGSGVTYTRVVDTNPNMRYYVLKVDVKAASTIDTQMAGSTLGKYAPTSTIAKNANALAAINGDFTSNGMPVHPFTSDGSVMESGRASGGSFGFTKSETNLYTNDAALTITGKSLRTGKTFAVEGMNESSNPVGGEVLAFSDVGGSLKRPPSSNACEVRLDPSSAPKWATGKKGVTRQYTAKAATCSGSLAVGNGLVLAANKGGSQAQTLKDLKTGDKVDLNWQLSNWADVTDSVGGAPMLVRNGNNVAPNNCHSYFCDRNPRSGIGITKSGQVLLVIVDGRSSSSVGMTPSQFGKLFVDLGATYALNLDGGGGSTMYIKGKGVVNSPSDGSERPVTNAVLVLDHADPGTPKSLRALTSLPVSSPSAAQAAQQAAMQDPASTGGLYGTLGP